ncbi:MAG: hypothetical protein WBV21_18185 [Desulfobacterales bacterium]|jgi:hypothetical protein
MTSLTARTVILRVEQAVNIKVSSKAVSPNKKACRLGRDGGPLCIGIALFTSVRDLCNCKRQIRRPVSLKAVFMAIILTKKMAPVYRRWQLGSDVVSLRIQENNKIPIAEKGHLWTETK